MNQQLTLPRVFLALLAIFASVIAVPNPSGHASDAIPISPSSPQIAHGRGDPYLLLVNTAIAFQMNEAKLRQFDKSAYDGIAIAFLHAYDTSEVPNVATMDSKLAEWRHYTNKDIWPWVYVNRAVGMSAAENNSHSDVPYFRRIQGMDLDDKNGALSDYFEIWSNSLHAARDTKAPGVVCDIEFYNYYKEYDIGEIARNSGKQPGEVAESLRAIGARMADIAAKEYPDSILWFLFTGLTHAGYKTYSTTPYYPSPAYIAIGLLDEITRLHLPLKVLAGGEGSIGYCHENLQEFRSAIHKREIDLHDQLQKYQGVLSLAGTMTLWSDQASKKDWVNEGNCKTSAAATVEDLEPYLELLFSSYRFNWIYASGDGNYLPFSPENATRFDRVISKARTRASVSH